MRCNPTQLVLATANAGKLAELRAMLAGSGISVLPQTQFNVPAVDETGLSFVENAIIKARHASACSGMAALADDSGLEVDALAGAPGIHSARYAGIAASDSANNSKLLAALQDVPDDERSARFHCVLALLRDPGDPMPLICHGTWEGTILRRPEGESGFGYDPLFFVPEQRCSSAQLPASIKNRLSHRARALMLLMQALGLPC